MIFDESTLPPFDHPLDVENVPEFHAGRLLLLLQLCGSGPRRSIKGRTKLAKLDFFVRYPRFLEAALLTLQQNGQQVIRYNAGADGVEASMIRYRFGPWDRRYYNLVAMLRARGLISIRGSVDTFSLTSVGRSFAQEFAELPAFAAVMERCRIVAATFGGLTGTQLKTFIHKVFDEEVGTLAHGVTIESPRRPRGPK